MNMRTENFVLKRNGDAGFGSAVDIPYKDAEEKKLEERKKRKSEYYWQEVETRVQMSAVI